MEQQFRNELESALGQILRATREELRVRSSGGGDAAPEVVDSFKLMIQRLEELIRGEHDTLTCRAFREKLFTA